MPYKIRLRICNLYINATIYAKPAINRVLKI